MVKNKKLNKKRISPNSVALISAIAITIGGFFLLYNFIGEKRLQAYDYMNEKISDNETAIYDVNTREISDTNEEIKQEYDIENYIGYLEIPKIKFRRGFYNLDSTLNTVESNIEVIEGSNMPNIENSNLIIAGHSGTGWKAFFKDLYKLDYGDEAVISYGGLNYKYKITNIYQVDNTGTVAIKRNYDKTTLTLITCTKDDSTTQTVYIAELYTIE